MKRTSHHAKMRISERGNELINTSNKNLAKNVIKNGIELKVYYSIMGYSALVKWICEKRKIRNIQAYKSFRYFIYKDYLFIFNANLSKMITTYTIPTNYKGEIEKYPIIKEMINNKVDFSRKRDFYEESFEILFKLEENRYKNPKFYFKNEKDAKNYSLLIGLTNPLVKEILNEEIKENLSNKQIINNCIKKELIMIKKIRRDEIGTGILFDDRGQK